MISLARREGNRRFFDLTDRLYPPELLERRPPVREQIRHKLLSRYRGNGLLGDGGESTLWYGTGKGRRGADDPRDAIIRSELREELVAAGELVPVAVDGLRGPRYIVASDRGHLADAVDEVARGDALDGESVAFLAPLDPLAWDRDLLRKLFGFDYIWEVYVPAAKRRWGYYVLPILFGDRFVGRIRAAHRADGGTAPDPRACWEPGFDPARADGFVPAMREALAAYLRFGRVRTIDWPAGLGRERRLFGVRPKGA